MKVFNDLLQDDQEAYQALTNCIKLIDVDQGFTLFQEGEDGDLFYIIIQGEVEVLKASHQVIQYDSRIAQKPLFERKMEDKLDAYYKCFRQHYSNIFWP